MKRSFVFILLILLISCTDTPTKYEGTNSILIETVLINDGSSLNSLNYKTKEKQFLFSTNDTTVIYAFDYSKNTGDIYFILKKRDNINLKFHTVISRLTKEGEHIEIKRFVSCLDCEGSYTFNDINVSLNSEFLALDGALYEGGDFKVYGLKNYSPIVFNRGHYTEYMHFLVWDPFSDLAYVKSHQYLVEYNLIEKTIQMLSSPNIRDYMSTEDLLEQGYVGERMDYESLVGSKDFKYINWHYNGQHFVYQTGDRLFLYSLQDSINELVYEGGFDNPHIKNYQVIWHKPNQPINNLPYFNDKDIIVDFDSTALDTLVQLNDSIYYEIGKRHSIAYFQPNWNNRFHGFEQYYFRKKISQEKFHVAEMDFLFWTFALRLTPEFWFLLLKYESDSTFTESGLLGKFSTYVDDYFQDYKYFKSLNYPETLRSKKPIYDSLVYRDYRFHEIFLKYLSNKDFDDFSSSFHTLMLGEDVNTLNSVLDTLNATDMSEKRRLVIFYMLMNNYFLNYYGKVIYQDIEAIKDNLLIEVLSPDWLYRAIKKDYKYATRSYFEKKIYLFPE